MKKRILAVLLALVLLCCFVPFAAAADTTETAYLVLTDHLLNDMHIEQDGCTKLAVGDTIRVNYGGESPADVRINGKTVHTFPACEREVYVWEIKSTEPVTVQLVTAGQTLINRSFTIISDKDMYRQNLSEAGENLREAFGIALIPSKAFEAFAGTPVPVGNPFLGPVLIAEAFGLYFKALFSFTRL